jgi:hypothetical protein
MLIRRGLVAVVTAGVLLGAAVPSYGATRYQNCTKLNKAYPHGVGRPAARDRTSGVPVTSFAVNRSVYAVNRGSDRDGDGIACEKR